MICPRLAEKFAIKLMMMIAMLEMTIPRKGILKACSTPPSADSLNPQSAVSLVVANEVAGITLPVAFSC